MSSGEERIHGLGSAVEDEGFVHLLRSRLFSLLQLTRNQDMYKFVCFILVYWFKL
jgi:hypothetical protein